MKKNIIMFGVLTIVLVGCRNSATTIPTFPTTPPSPAPQVNAILPDNKILYNTENLGGDIIIEIRISSNQEFASRQNGDWIQHWYLATADVLKVEKGNFPQNEIRFIYQDIWPTPESLIMIDKVPCPYLQGNILEIGLRMHSAKPFEIVNQKQMPK